MCKSDVFVTGAICLFTAILITVSARAGEATGSLRAPGPTSPAISSATADEAARSEAKLSLVSLGVVKRDGKRTFLVLDKKYAPGLVSVGDFSHVMVFYWCDRNDTPQKRSFLQGYRKGKAGPADRRLRHPFAGKAEPYRHHDLQDYLRQG